MTSPTAARPAPPEPGAQAGSRPARIGPAAEALAGVVLGPALLVVLVALAATPFLRAYDVAGASAYLLVAALAPVLVATIAGDRLGASPAISYGASLAGLVVLVVVMGGGDLGAVWAGLAKDPTRLLTETLPLTGKAELIIAPVALTWICAAATSECWTRSIRSALVLLPPVALFVLAYATTAGAPGTDAVSGPLLLGALVIAAVLRHRKLDAERGVIDVDRHRAAGQGAGPRAAAAGAGCAVALAVILGLVVPVLPGMGHPAAPLNRAAPQLSSVLIDPVEQIASLRDSEPHKPAQTLFSVHTNRPAPGYYGVATLDDYNGGAWTFDTTFGPSGGRIPPAPAGTPGAVSDTMRPTVTQEYRFDPAYHLAFVPNLDRPVEVRDLPIDADTDTGMILPTRPAPPSGQVSAVSATPPATLLALPPSDGIGTAAGAADAVETADTAVPAGTAADLTVAARFLGSLTGKEPAPTIAWLQDAAKAMTTKEKRIDPALRSDSDVAFEGTSLEVVINAVAVNKAATPEQFATFFVMVARYLGVPARVVTGFRVPAVGGGPGIAPAGTHEVTNREAWTWAEVPVAGVGWVVVDPTPAATTAAAKPPPPKASVTPTTLPPHHANAVPKNSILGGHAIAKPVHLKPPARAHHSPLATVLAAIAGAILLLLALGPGVALARRRFRRHVRHAADPASQTVGAWLDLLDGLHRSGMRAPGAATSAEVATEAGHHFGPEVVAPIGELGSLADRALFSVSAPPQVPEASRAWALTDEVCHDVAQTLDRRQRTRALLSVGATPRRPAGTRR